MKKIIKGKSKGVVLLLVLSMLLSLLPGNNVWAKTVATVGSLVTESGYGYTINGAGSAVYESGAKLRARVALSDYVYTPGDVLTIEYDTSLDAGSIKVLICNTNNIYETLGYLESGKSKVSFTLPDSSVLNGATPANYIRFQNNDGSSGDYFTVKSLTISRDGGDEQEGSASGSYADYVSATVNESNGYTLSANSDGSVTVSYTPGKWRTLDIGVNGCDLTKYSEMVIDITPVAGMNLGILDASGTYYRNHWGDGVFESGSRQTLTYSITSQTSGFVFYCDPPTGAALPSGTQTFTIHSIKFVNPNGDGNNSEIILESKADFTDFSGSGYELVSYSEGGNAQVKYSAGATVRLIANLSNYKYQADDVLVVNYDGIDDISSIEQVIIGYGTSSGQFEKLAVAEDTGSKAVFKMPSSSNFSSTQPTFIRFKGVLSSSKTSSVLKGMAIYDGMEYAVANSDGGKVYKDSQCPAGVAVTYYTDIYSRGFAWSTDDTVYSNSLEYVKAGSGMTADNVDWSKASTVAATLTESTDKDGVTWHLFKAHVKNLEQGAKYYFRAGDYETGYSKVGSFVVEGSSSSIDKLTFAHLTDAQEGSQSGYTKWAKVLKAAYKTAPDSSFVAFTGDLTNDSHATLNMWQWVWALDEPKDTLLNTVIAPSSGNHDTYAYSFTNRFDIKWADYDNGGVSDQKTGGCYAYTYGDDILFINLNTNEANGGNSTFKAQKEWMISQLETYKDCKWKIVQIHKGIMSGGDHTNDGEVDWLREILPPIFAKYEVDLVLQGHDHVYTRSRSYYYGDSYDGLTPNWDDPVIYKDYNYNGESRLLNLEPCGTHYVTINYCANKSYPEETNLDEVIYEGENPISGNDCIVQPNLPMYGIVYIDGDMMIYDAYTYDVSAGKSTLYDTFAVKK